MEAIKEVALAIYENLPDAEKLKTQNDFKNFTANNVDNNFSVSEVQEFLNTQMADEILQVLDLNMERRLDFNDFVAFKYMKENPCLVICDECSLLIRPGRCFFSCFECFIDEDSGEGYTLCCDCYRAKSFIGHEHSEFCDNFTLLVKAKAKIVAKQEFGSKKDEGNKFLNKLTAKLVNELLVEGEKIKSIGWEEYSHKFLDFEMKDKFGEIYLHLNKLEEKPNMNVSSSDDDIFHPIRPRPTIEF